MRVKQASAATAATVVGMSLWATALGGIATLLVALLLACC